MLAPDKREEIAKDQEDLKVGYQNIMASPAGVDLRTQLESRIARAHTNARTEMDDPVKATMHLQREDALTVLLDYVNRMSATDK